MTVTVITPTQGYTFDDVLWIQLKDQTRIHMKSDAGSIEIQSEDGGDAQMNNPSNITTTAGFSPLMLSCPNEGQSREGKVEE